MIKPALVALFLVIAVLLPIGGCKTEPRMAPANDPPARAADTQKEALRLAANEDLPAVKRANRVTATLVRDSAKERTITDPEVLKAILAALTVKETPPSGGVTWAKVTWLAGDSVIRQAWVYEDGEWGFERPGTAWTVGESPALAKLLRQLVTEGK